MKNRIAAALLALCTSSMLMAEVVTVQVSGTGPTHDTAIEQGLIHAVRQINGTDINSQQTSATAQSRVNGKTNTQIDVSRNTELEAKGQVAGYEVTDSSCSTDGCTVDLSVQVHQFKAPGLPTEKRRRIAVLPFTGGKEFRKMVTQNVEEQLVQSRRFAVLDREHEKEYEAEKSLWQSNDVPVAEKARLGQVLGLDYIVTGSIEKAGVHRWTTSIALTGEKKNHVRTSATVRYQVIAVATRQIMWSDTASVTLDNIGSLEQAAVTSGKKISVTLLDNIYPLRVVALDNDQIILNQGGKTIKNGSYYNIYSLGEMIIDPYTQEPLGRSETQVATIKVTRIEAKMAYGKVVEGDINVIQQGFIARAASNKNSPGKKPSSSSPVSDNVSVPEAGGVIL